MTAPVTFKQDDLTRACKGVKAAGLQVSRVVVEPGGQITIVTGDGQSAKAVDPNPWSEGDDAEEEG